VVSQAGESTLQWRVRLLLAPDGRLDVQVVPLQSLLASRESQLPLLIVGGRDAAVSSTWPLLYHKTSERAVYDRARLAAGCTSDGNVLDAVLVNERGLVTEGCIGNLIIEMAIAHAGQLGGLNGVADADADARDGLWDGQVEEAADAADATEEDAASWPVPAAGCVLVTPPMRSGLLPGVLRARALALRHGGLITREVTAAELLNSAACRRVWLINSVRGWVQARPVRWEGY